MGMNNFGFHPYSKDKQLGKHQKDKDMPKLIVKKPKKKPRKQKKAEVVKGRTIPSKSVRGRITKKEYILTQKIHGEECYFCGTTANLECHHVMPKGFSKHKNGRGVYRNLRFLCSEHHRGKESVHQNRDMMNELQELHEKMYGQYYHCDRYDLFKLGLIENTTVDAYEKFMNEERERIENIRERNGE